MSWTDDGYVILARSNHDYAAVLKNALDSTFVEVPVPTPSPCGLGQHRRGRAVEQLREVAVEFEMAPLRHAVHVLPDVLIAVRQSEDPTDLSLLRTLSRAWP